MLSPTSGSFFVPSRGALGVPAGEGAASLDFLNLLNMMMIDVLVDRVVSCRKMDIEG